MSDETGAGGGRNAATVATGIFTSRVFGLVREALVAKYLGVGAHADVYGAVFRLPNLLQNLLGEQTLSAAFIPRYSRLVEEGRHEEAGRLAGAVFGLLMAAAGGLALVGILLARPLVAIFLPGFVDDAGQVAAGILSVDRFELAVRMVRVLFPMAGVLVLSAWALAILNSHRRFLVPYMAPVAWNAAIIATLWWFGEPLVRGEGMAAADRTSLLVAVAWGALVGGGLQFLVQLPFVARVLRGFRPRVSLAVPGTREVVSAMGPMIAGRGAVQLSGYLDVFLASFLAAGAVSSLQFAQRLYFLPVGLFAMSVAAAELPDLARLGAAGPSEALRERLEGGVRQAAFLAVPTAFGYLGFGFLLVGALYRRGSFGYGEQALVTIVLATYTAGLVPSITSRVYQNLYFSFDDTRFPARVAVLRVAVAAGVGAAVMHLHDRVPVTSLGLGVGEGLRLGAVGLAAGSAVGAWVEVVVLVREGRRRLDGTAFPWRAAARMVALSVVSALAAGALVPVVLDWPIVLSAAVVVGAYAGAYLGASALIGVPELGAWVGRLGGRGRGSDPGGSG